jgi:putative tricarboxylic transport membrane protein
MSGKPVWGDVLLGLGVVILAAVVGWQTTLIPLNAVYAKVGPNVIPWIVTAMLGGLGLFLTIQGVMGGWPHEQEGELEWASLGWLLAALLANVALIDFVGFIIASTLMFTLTARAFKSTQPLRDAAIGFTLAVIAYVGFDRVLGYKIGEGLIERFI